jgi:biotin carboxylase
MKNVIFAAPFPLETTMRFARAAARLSGVRLLGLVQEPPRRGSDDATMFHDMVRLDDALDPRQLIEGALLLRQRHGPIHRVLGILEPLQVQLAEVRAALGIPGPDVKTADLFRDKARMKDELRRHELPCARHAVIRSLADAQRFVGEVGFPIVVKPPAGMGCKATWRIRDAQELAAALGALRASAESPCVAEEFLRGREYSFETITVAGEVRMTSLTRYFPAPLEVMETPWIHWAVVLPRRMDGPEFEGVEALGVGAVKALGLETGMTHMEWFRKDDGTLAIGEIAARPPGAHIVLANGYAHDIDMYRVWARAVIDEAFDGPFERKFAVGVAFLRGVGRGRVTRVTGVDEANRRVGQLVMKARLPTPGDPRSDHYEGDGYVVVRDPDTEVVKAAVKTIIETIGIQYG